MSDAEIREVTSDADRRDVFPILVQLRDHLDEESYFELLEEMRAEGYRLFARFVDDEPVAVAGVTIATNFYLGRHAYVYDLVTTAEERSNGHGERLLEFVHEWAAENDCDAVELESGLWRDDAHRFYTDRMGYEKYCYSFVYDLS
ncbi:GNAT family N-acetyltransferase [Natrinema gelatinilyticum]|uniref:GNAT family N-acetyltransferase n=1 Tax=Natrinema gelatinilyticum TaxID=2961571 RepID=UPI0020C1BA79|nr:GNAT family N-acetyltransferase [Natrinema gelatinilyticum]